MAQGQRVVTLGGMFVHMPAIDEQRHTELSQRCSASRRWLVPTVHTPV